MEISKVCGRSLMKIKNNNGPKWDPWGTPDRTENFLENWKEILTTWVWFVR